MCSTYEEPGVQQDYLYVRGDSLGLYFHTPLTLDAFVSNHYISYHLDFCPKSPRQAQ